jgi:hypothetical protein
MPIDCHPSAGRAHCLQRAHAGSAVADRRSGEQSVCASIACALTNRTVISPRHRPWRRPPQDARLSPRPLRRRRSDARREPFAGHRQGLRPSDFVGLDRPRQTERKPGIGSMPKTDLSAVIAPDARKSFVEIVFCQIAQRAVSDQKSGVNNVPQVKTASPQWDSRARPREASALQVHGVTKDRASFPWPLVRHRFVRTFAPCTSQS